MNFFRLFNQMSKSINRNLPCIYVILVSDSRILLVSPGDEQSLTFMSCLPYGGHIEKFFLCELKFPMYDSNWSTVVDKNDQFLVYHLSEEHLDNIHRYRTGNTTILLEKCIFPKKTNLSDAAKRFSKAFPMETILHI